MTVLVVDDQPDVVRGILEGVNWKKLHVDRALGAGSAEEARGIFKTQHVDILLCDIEMPAENGIQLCAWVQEHDPMVRCIILTSHADFSYAQQALKLGASDYILQPARYEVIENALQKAMLEQWEKKSLSAYSKQAMQEERRYSRHVLQDYLLGMRQVDDTARCLMPFGFQVQPDTVCRFILVQRFSWIKEPWETDLLLYAMQNVMEEVMSPAVRQSMALSLPPDQYGMLLVYQSEQETGKNMESITLFAQFFREEVGLQAAIYVDNPAPFSNMPASLVRLQACSRDNVTGQEGVFSTGSSRPTLPDPADFARWKNLLRQGGCTELVEKEIEGYLQDLTDRGLLNSEALRRFHEDYLQMFFALMQEYQDSAHEVFRETYDYELMLQSGESLKKLRQFIHFTLGYLGEKAEPETGGRAQIDRVLEFIHQNIQRNIGRKEIAQAVYLNPEYLSRLFKKEMHIGLTEYLTQERMKIAQTLLRSTSLPIGLVASRVGYVNFSHFARIFKKEYGVSPSEYRQTYRNVQS